MLTEAIAARVSQAEAKDWTKFTKDTDAAIRSLVLPKISDAPKKDDKRMGQFFSQLAKAKGSQQIKGKL